MRRDGAGEEEEERSITSPILVTGGTGTLGRLVVPRLRDAGHDVRVLSRRRAGGADFEDRRRAGRGSSA